MLGMSPSLLLLWASVSCAAAATFAPHSNATKCNATSACWPTDWANLKAALPNGTVVLPSDKAWASAIKLKNKRLSGVIVPGAVVLCSSAGDVAAAMAFAAHRNLLLSVKSSGHCYSGNCMLNHL